jgi:threonine/homoserine/homoserine lactone efflux protein
MIDLPTFAVFAAACVALAATPGPDMLLIASRSASQGPAAGFASLAGIQVGTYCHALAAAVGLAQLFVAVPVAFDAVRYAGAAYLLLLAWQAFRATGSFVVAADSRRYGLAAMFRQGLLTNLLNPKMALFVLALLPQFVRPDAGSVVVQFIVLATLLNMIGLVVNGAIILAAGRLRRIISSSGRWQRLSQIFLGTVFAGLALRLAFDGRK